MPANLTPAYLQAEARCRGALTPEQKIDALEEMLRVLPRHKGTDKLHADLRARLAKVRREPRKGPARGHGHRIPKEGAAEGAALLATVEQGWGLVSEHRDYPVRMRDFLPHHWTVREHTDAFTAHVLRGESFTFQLALIAGPDSLRGVRATFDGFPPAFGETLTCFNCGVIDEKGERFVTDVSVPAGAVQPL